MHAFIFPTAIRIETQNSAYQFTSFRSRSSTLDQLVKLLQNFKQKQENQYIPIDESLERSGSVLNTFMRQNNARSMQGTEIWSEEDDLNESDDKNHDLTIELLSNTDEETSIDVDDKLKNCFLKPRNTCFSNFIAYDQYKKHNNIDSDNQDIKFMNTTSCLNY